MKEGRIEILMSRWGGFCFGVKRAIKLVRGARKQGKVYTLGPLIHNELVVENLKKEGIFPLDLSGSVIYPKDGFLVIRTHGAEKGFKERLEMEGYKVIDATCPYISRSQRYAQKLSDEGYFVLIFGDPLHPEVKSIKSYVKNGIVVSSLEDLNSLNFPSKVGVLSQTTQDFSEFKKVVWELIGRAKEIKVLNTVCDRVLKAQREAEIKSENVDLVLVVGSTASSNTSKLYKICKSKNSNTYQIESFKDLKESWLLNVKKVFITAGASTPDWNLKEIIEKIKG